MNESTLLRTEIRTERDVVTVRQRARQLAALLGFDAQDQTRIATAVSEIARNAYEYAGGGRAVFLVDPRSPQAYLVRISDEGPGIAELSAILDGRYESPTGMGLGIVGARRLTDRFEIATTPGAGTVVTLGKLLPARILPIAPEHLGEIGRALAAALPRDPIDELQAQNRELLQTLEVLRNRQAEVERLNVELEETNRGVLALYAELDDRALELARASELKSTFLSNISHELRTPLNSVLNLTRMLLDRADGELSAEQERQVGMIRSAATTLLDMVGDLLDLARIEAGKSIIRLGDLEVADLLGALRGMLRPLLSSGAVALVVEAPEASWTLQSDEAKVAQILRNLIGNAIKFTERGTIRVTADRADGGWTTFRVIDTGIGIAAEDLDRIFEPYAQVDGRVQRRSAGSGLGLPLSLELARLLGGTLTVESEVGRGSTFTLRLPPRCPIPAVSEDPAVVRGTRGAPTGEAQHV